MRISKNREKYILFFITFFTFAGYNAGLAIFIGAGLNTTFLYSVPLRILSTLVMIYYIAVNFNATKNKKSKIVFIFILFSLFYIFKVIFTFGFFTPYAPYRFDWFEYIFYYLNFCFLPFLSYASMDFNEENKRTILDTLIFAGFLLSLICIVEYKSFIFSGSVARIGTNSKTDGDTITPLALSYSGVLSITLCIFQLIYQIKTSRKYKWYLYLNIFLGLFMFLLGSSRGSLVAIAFCIPLFLIYSRVKDKLKVLLTILIAIPLFIYGALATGSNIFQSLSSTGSATNQSDRIRLNLWSQAKAEFFKYPVFGGRIEVSGFYPHNIALEILMATGIVGMLLFLCVFGSAFRRAAHICKRNHLNIFIFILFLQGLSQCLVAGGLYADITVFYPMGLIFSSYKT